VYGRRATPYQVLSDFAQRIGGAYSSADVLPQMAQTVAAGTGAEQVVVWLRVDDQLHPGASTGGSPDTAPGPVDGQMMPALPDADMSVPVVYGGDLLGAISIQMPKVSPLRPVGQRLVADVASRSRPGAVERQPGRDLRASPSAWSTRARRGGAWNLHPRRGTAGPGRAGYQSPPRDHR
jgi:hypothetical protein